MKFKTTKKEIKDNYYRIIKAGYCELQNLLQYKNPIAYSSGVYGWACDYYEINGVLISTGYRPVGNQNVECDYKLIREYDNKAMNKTKEERETLLNEFIAKCKTE